MVFPTEHLVQNGDEELVRIYGRVRDGDSLAVCINKSIGIIIAQVNLLSTMAAANLYIFGL